MLMRECVLLLKPTKRLSSLSAIVLEIQGWDVGVLFFKKRKKKTELDIFLETSAMAIYNVLVYLECLLVWTFKTKHRFYQDRPQTDSKERKAKKKELFF